MLICITNYREAARKADGNRSRSSDNNAHRGLGFQHVHHDDHHYCGRDAGAGVGRLARVHWALVS